MLFPVGWLIPQRVAYVQVIGEEYQSAVVSSHQLLRRSLWNLACCSMMRLSKMVQNKTDVSQ